VTIGMFGTFVTLMRGGGEQYALCLSRELVRLGHSVTLICGRSFLRRPLSIPDSHLFGIRIRPYLFEIREMSRFGPRLLGRVLYGLSRRFHQWAIRNDFSEWDVIHVGTVETAQAAIRRRQPRQPIVLTLHGPVPPVDRELLASLDAVVPTGHRVAEQVSRELGVSCIVIPAGLDLPKFSPMDRTEARRRLGWSEAPQILFVGRLIPIKNLEVLLKGFCALLRALPEARLTLVGAGVLRGRLEALADRLGIHHRVWFEGALSQDMLPWYYNAADLFILPSHYESFGQVALEAFACECPVIVSDGVTEIVTRFPETRVFPKDEPQALAEVMIRTLEKRPPPVPREQLRPFDWPEIGRQYINLYSELIRKRAA
jgi:glycosyltransferase involved in cell wall biosynthesis